MPKKHCCDTMEHHLQWKCEQHEDQYDCADAIITHTSQYDEYGLIIHDGGTSKIIIDYCPWCGQKLPESKRDLWFETLEKLGFKDPSFDDDIPDEFRSEKWYKI